MQISPSSWNLGERIDEGAWPATDRAAQPEIGPPSPPAGQLGWQRDGNRRGDRFSTAEWCRRNDRKGTLIRHASWRVTSPVRQLAVAMIERPSRLRWWRWLAARCCRRRASVRQAGLPIALPAITVRANPEHRLASLAATNPRPENPFSMNRHPPTGAAFDNCNGSCEGGTSFDGVLRMKVAKPGPRCFYQRGSLPPSKATIHFLIEMF
jgi:hypothetical protein